MFLLKLLCRALLIATAEVKLKPPKHPGLLQQHNSSELMSHVCVHVHQEWEEPSLIGLHACLHIRKLPIRKFCPGGASDHCHYHKIRNSLPLNLHSIQPCRLYSGSAAT